MKHTTEELLLAAAVRERVAKLLVEHQPMGLTEADGDKWRNQNAASYTKQVMAELSMFADLIKASQEP